ncbi:hypothetical protein KI387_023305, partial [Taxus chinensis]
NFELPTHELYIEKSVKFQETSSTSTYPPNEGTFPFSDHDSYYSNDLTNPKPSVPNPPTPPSTDSDSTDEEDYVPSHL